MFTPELPAVMGTITSGGRVLGVTALGRTSDRQSTAPTGRGMVSANGVHYRTDSGRSAALALTAYGSATFSLAKA